MIYIHLKRYKVAVSWHKKYANKYLQMSLFVNRFILLVMSPYFCGLLVEMFLSVTGLFKILFLLFLGRRLLS